MVLTKFLATASRENDHMMVDSPVLQDLGLEGHHRPPCGGMRWGHWGHHGRWGPDSHQGQNFPFSHGPGGQRFPAEGQTGPDGYTFYGHPRGFARGYSTPQECPKDMKKDRCPGKYAEGPFHKPG